MGEKRTSYEWKFKAKLDESERIINDGTNPSSDHDPATSESLNEVLNVHESPVESPNHNILATVVIDQTQEDESATMNDQQATKSTTMLRKKKSKKPLKLGSKAQPHNFVNPLQWQLRIWTLQQILSLSRRLTSRTQHLILRRCLLLKLLS